MLALASCESLSSPIWQRLAEVEGRASREEAPTRSSVSSASQVSSNYPLPALLVFLLWVHEVHVLVHHSKDLMFALLGITLSYEPIMTPSTGPSLYHAAPDQDACCSRTARPWTMIPFAVTQFAHRRVRHTPMMRGKDGGSGLSTVAFVQTAARRCTVIGRQAVSTQTHRKARATLFAYIGLGCPASPHLAIVIDAGCSAKL